MTTDGIRRKQPHAPQGPKVDAKVDANLVANLVEKTTSETAGGAAAKRALDALDDVKGTATGSRGKQGVNAALAGLAAVEPKKKTWRAAVTGALLGLTLLTGANPAHAPQVWQQQTLVEKTTGHSAFSLRIPAGAPPPDPKPGYQLTAEHFAGTKPVVILTDSSSGPIMVDVANVRRSMAREPAATTPPTTTPPTTTPPTTTTPSTMTPPTTTPSIDVRVRGGLPETLATLHTGMTVVHGSDAGDFYCEHAFFTTTSQAMRADTTILRNADGEVLTGFLHVPADAFTYSTAESATKVQAERHAERRAVVGAAIRGFYEDARTQLDPSVDRGAFRMLLTGYLQWGSVVDNPTGDFTGHSENVDAAMRRAFGADLVTSEGRVVDTRQATAGMSSTTLEYKVKDDKAPNGVRIVLIEAAQLPVTDAAINGGDASLQRLIERGQPHAVMSMGVAFNGAFQAEFHADDGGLRVDGDTGAITHDDGKSPSTNHPDNYALGRAIHRGIQNGIQNGQELNGARPIVIATATIVGGGD